MAAIVEIYFALLLLNRKANLSDNQVSDTGPYWPSCLIWILVLKLFDGNECTSGEVTQSK